MGKARQNIGAEAGPAASVLLVDEAPGRFQLLRGALSAAGFFVDTASDAAAVTEKLSARIPGLLITDLRLSGADGLPLWYGLLADPELEGVPIIALTSSSHLEQWRELAGLFDDYLCDPVDPAAVVARMQSLITRVAVPAPAPAGRRSSQTSSPTLFCDSLTKAELVLQEIDAACPESQFQPDTAPSLRQLAEVVASFDSAALPEHLRHAERLTAVATARSGCAFRSLIRLCREALNGDSDPAPEFAELRAQYLDNRAAELKTLADALDCSDFAKLASAGHNLKGTGAAYGFAELTEIGKALETAAKAADPLCAQILLGRIAFYVGLVRRGVIPA